jgi:hypothetical protein
MEASDTLGTSLIIIQIWSFLVVFSSVGTEEGKAYGTESKRQLF